jgi:hypothetical protein
VTVLNTKDTIVTLDHLYTIFSPFGEVVKIVTFIKQKLVKALVELGSVQSAINAKAALEGKHIFPDSWYVRSPAVILARFFFGSESALERE